MPINRIGGGCAGASAADHLRMRDDVAITLVNPRPQFVERVRLHQSGRAPWMKGRPRMLPAVDQIRSM
jgi:hypothetical protein